MANDAVTQLTNGIKGLLDAADKDKTTLSNKSATVLAEAGALLGTAGAILSIAATIVSLTSPQTPTDLQIIEELTTQIKDAISAVDEDVRILAIKDVMTPPVGDLQTLRNEGKNGQDVNKAIFFQNALNAVNNFTDDDMNWYRSYNADHIFAPHAVSIFTTWYGDLPNPKIGTGPASTTDLSYSNVFDPRLALPAYLKALELFVAINAILEDDTFKQFVGQWRTTIEVWADSLEGRYKTAVNGLVMTDLPSLNDVASYLIGQGVDGVNPAVQEPSSPFVTILKSGTTWNLAYGVADVYGSYPGNLPVNSASKSPYHIVDLFTQDGLADLPRGIPGIGHPPVNVQDAIYPWVKGRVGLGLKARWKAIYLIRGYDQAWSALQSLRVITGQQSAPQADLNRDWSARDLIKELGIAGDQQGHYRLSSLVQLLDRLAKGNWNIPAGRLPNPARPFGFRDRLAAAAV